MVSSQVRNHLCKLLIICSLIDQFPVTLLFQPVIYKPGDGGGSVMKYSISGRINGDIIPMSQSTLISSTFSQTISTTTMEFVMLMNGPSASDLDIVGGVVNSFVFAYGQENTFGYHKGRGSFDLDLQTLSPTKGPTTRKPTTSKPTTRKPTSKPTTRYPTTSKPTTRKPTSKPTTRKPTTTGTSKPTTRKPTSKPTY